MLTSLVFAPFVHASSFDCASASSKTEKAICADPYLSELDEKLAQQWRSSLAKVADPKALKTDQRQWLKSRNACGDSAACLRRQYVRRLAELEHAVQPFNWDATWQLIPPGPSTSATVVTKQVDATHISVAITAGEGPTPVIWTALQHSRTVKPYTQRTNAPSASRPSTACWISRKSKPEAIAVPEWACITPVVLSPRSSR
ncbi:lysozyme inhibitor LprI family protein [Pseudomonas sp. H22_DOA]|nr:lysozyme inhibitor LprI family protein [Pseudomonas sp. H22_DOA]